MRHKLRQLRLQRGVSQTYISKRLGYRYPSGYGNIEMGRNNLTLENAKIIAEILGVTVDELIEEEIFFPQKLHGMSNTEIFAV